MNMLRTTVYLAFCGLLLVGCSHQSVSPAPGMMSLTQFNARRLDNADLKKFMWDAGALHEGESLPAWWGFKSLYWAALYYNPSLAEARAQIEAAKAVEVTAGQSPNPTITLAPGRDTTTTPAAWLLDVGFSIPIETNGKRELRKAIALAQTLSAQSQLVSKAWDVRSAVLNSLLDYDIASETLKRTETLEKTQAAITAEYNERLSQGQLPTANASQAQISYQQSHLQLEQARTDLKQAEVKLAGAIGVPLTALEAVHIGDKVPPVNEALLLDKKLRRAALASHPLLVGALADYRAAHEALQLEVAKRVPDIDLGPGYEWNSVQGEKITLGITLILPIMNDNEGPIAEATAKRLQAARHFDTLQAAVINSIEQATILRHSARRELAAAKEIVDLQHTKQTRLESMIQRNQAGTLPLLYAESEVQTAQVSELVAKAKLLKASAALEDALRMPLFGPVIGTELLSLEHEGAN